MDQGPRQGEAAPRPQCRRAQRADIARSRLLRCRDPYITGRGRDRLREESVAGSGKLKGAVHVSRGMLEFRADPDSPAYLPLFQRDKPVLVYCASGGRSALAGKVLKDFGYQSVYNAGGFKELADAGIE